ncbi:phosphoserine phosphatase SerB [Pseudoalteromonas sp. HL-AS1]|uniref:phosphoserine phosphatase SerB n=1 Tax=Pseudoalteromonas sp. HL-AS1 TaxID=3071081 RepID=UPI0028156CEA|nr:phosphoserine phosphatase SerB [Pseudoalteromonas sp. HL-AS1]WMS91609.1 phosphoserine phosphatase SerB [Pseudoalteromonas sp. HL-AS1]
MSQINMAQQAAEQPLQHLTLNKWFSYSGGVSTPLDYIPNKALGLFSIAFAGDFTEKHIASIVDFLATHNQKVTAICQYQPDLGLAPALCFYAQNADKTINPLVLQQFSSTLDFQLVQIACPPNLYEPGLLVMDMDSTAITIECIDEIARLANVYDEVASVTALAMAGKLDFSESLNQRVAKLTGIEKSLIDELKNNLPLMPGIKMLCQILKQHQWHLAIASGGFVPFAEQVQALINLDEVHANVLEFKDNKLTGKVLGAIVDAQQKAVILESLQQQLGLIKSQTVAIGDGANDLKMMATAGLGVAVHGKAKVVEQAQAAICQGSLLQLLYMLAIPLNSVATV